MADVGMRGLLRVVRKVTFPPEPQHSSTNRMQRREWSVGKGPGAGLILLFK